MYKKHLRILKAGSPLPQPVGLQVAEHAAARRRHVKSDKFDSRQGCRNDEIRNIRRIESTQNLQAPDTVLQYKRVLSF